ncbi:hypothetical protein ACERIT_02645 [Halopenitus sp. H-Gu1]
MVADPPMRGSTGRIGGNWTGNGFCGLVDEAYHVSTLLLADSL